jgi:hypothetical protein
MRRNAVTHLHVEDLPDEATVMLLGACTGASWSADSVFDAQLTQLRTDELVELRPVLTAGADAGDDDEFADWCTRMSQLVTAELYLRVYHQVAIDAKAAAIVDEERRIARVAQLSTPSGEIR